MVLLVRSGVGSQASYLLSCSKFHTTLESLWCLALLPMLSKSLTSLLAPSERILRLASHTRSNFITRLSKFAAWRAISRSSHQVTGLKWEREVSQYRAARKLDYPWPEQSILEPTSTCWTILFLQSMQRLPEGSTKTLSRVFLKSEPSCW